MKKIILAIDDDLCRFLYQKILKENNFEVLACESKDQVFKFINENQIDLLIIDIALEGMKGLEIIEKIKKEKKTKEIPILPIGIWETKKIKERLENLGIKEFISTAFTPPREFGLKVKLLLGQTLFYQIKVEIGQRDLEKLVRDLGFVPVFFCTKCQFPLEMLLLREPQMEGNLFKVVFICPNCKDIYFEK